MDYKALDRDYVWHPYTELSMSKNLSIPVFAKGEGIHLVDTDGEKYIDTHSSWWTMNLGHSHPELLQALKDQVDVLQHSIIGSQSHPAIAKLSQKLCSHFEDSERHVYYTSDGSCAVEIAIKVSLQYWHNIGVGGKKRIASLRGAYHGDTLGSLSLCYIDDIHHYYNGVVTPALQLDFPDPKQDQDQSYESLDRIFAEHGHSLAAVVLEPMCQGAGGMRVYRAQYLKKIEALCRQHQILLVVDEIAMGYGRTGKMFAHEHAGISPDIICVGKGLTNGYLPMSAAAVKNHIYETFTDEDPDNDKTFFHGHTYSGNPTCAAVALKVLELYERDRIVEKSEMLGQLLSREMNEFNSISYVADVRTLGMVAAVEIDPEHAKVKAASEQTPLVSRVLADLFERNILVRSLGNVIYLMMPLVTPEETIKYVIDNLFSVMEYYD